MKPSLEKIKEVRERTGTGVLDCQHALAECGDDVEKAIEHLRKKGIAQAEKKLARATAEGVVDAYLHPGSRLGVLLEVDCETDFVARTADFRQFVHDLAMQIAACDPIAIAREDIPAEVVERERTIYSEQAAASGRPPQIVEKIAAGKLEKFYADACLLEQPYVKSPEKTVNDFVREQISKFGENIRVRRFARFKLGE